MNNNVSLDATRDIDLYSIGNQIVSWLEVQVPELGTMQDKPPVSTRNREGEFVAAILLLSGEYMREKGHTKSNSYEVVYQIRVFSMDEAEDQCKKDLEEILWKVLERLDNPQGMPPSGPPFGIDTSTVKITEVYVDSFTRVAMNAVSIDLHALLRKR